jgi:redox-sensitive bicupin YhaK (pirin superfamily)
MTTTILKQGRHIPAHEVTEGAGVTVHRTIGTPAMRNLDPFMMLDQISSDNPDDYIAGFPPHPHRGFNTFTYMIDGDMEHKDSMGNTGNLGAGGAQWMKAGSGVIHSEMPKQEGGLMRGFQLWINLPAAQKMDAPEYQEYKSDAFPVVESDGVRVKVVVGEYGDARSPIEDTTTDVRYLDVTVESGGRFVYQLPDGHNRFLYLFEGEGAVDTRKVDDKMLVTLSGDDFEFIAGEQGARFLLVTGSPINEPIVQYGPFVMNTREEIDQAMQDYQNNDFVRDKAWVNRRSVTGQSKSATHAGE